MVSFLPSVMAVQPPLHLDGCLNYICSGSLRPSPIPARTNSIHRSSFSLSHRRRTLNESWVSSSCWTLPLAAIPSSAKILEALRFPRPLSTTLQTSYLPWTLTGTLPPLHCLAPANTLEVAVSLSSAPLELENYPSPLPLP
jgi:hypothetical protein